VNVSALLDTLRKLEVAMHQPHVRTDHRQLERLLHPNFFEVGRSGAHQGWQLRFHQGTPVAVFEKHPT